MLFQNWADSNWNALMLRPRRANEAGVITEWERWERAANVILVVYFTNERDHVATFNMKLCG